MSACEPLPPVAAPVAPKRPNRFLGFWGAVLLLVMVVAAQIFCGITLAIIHLVLSGGTMPTESQMAGGIAVSNTISIAVVIWFGLWWSKLPWRRLLPLTRFHPLLLAPLLAAAWGLCILVSDAENLTRFLGLEPALFREAVGQLAQGGWWSMIALVVVAPLTEEPLVRGVMLTGLLRRYSAARAVLYSAILFGVMHLNPVQFAAGLATGLFLGWLYTRTRSLWPGIVVHAIYNAHVFLIPAIRDGLDIHVRGFTGPALPGIVEFQPAWFDALGLGLLALGVWGVLRLTPPAACDAAPGDGAEADAGVAQAIINAERYSDKDEKMVGRSRRFWHVAFLAVLIYVGLFGATVLYINLCERPETDTIRIVTSTPSLGLRASVWVWDHVHWVLLIAMLGNVLAAVGFWLRSEDRPAAVCLIVYGVLQSLMLILGFIATWVVVSNNRGGWIVSTRAAGNMPKSVADSFVFLAYSLPLLLLGARGFWVLVKSVK